MTQPPSFTVRGSRNGSPVQISWTGGKLAGDPPTVDLVLVEAELAKLHPGDHQSWSRVTYADDALAEDPLGDPASAWQLIRNVLDTVTGVEGDAPPDALERLRRSGRGQR
jgi:hypothetical protein